MSSSFRFWQLIPTVLLFSSLALAQTLPPQTVDDQMGTQPFNTYHGGDIDQINLATGALSLDFPLLSYPQRGKLPLSFDLYYNTQPQHYVNHCVGTGQTRQCGDQWGWTPARPPLPLQLGTAFVDWAQRRIVYGTNTSIILNQGLQTQISKFYSRWSVQTADGATHPLGNMGTQSTVSGCPGCTDPHPLAVGTGPWEALDATGLRVNGALTASFPAPTSTASSYSIVDPSGNLQIFNGLSVTEQDANGNVITPVFNSSNQTVALTDTLGRQIPMPPQFSQESVSNVPLSQCPAGPLPVTLAMAWTVPAPASGGGTGTYIFCYATVGINSPPVGTLTFFNNPPSSSTLMQSLVLPDGHSWTFQYNDPGDGSTYQNAPVSYGTLTQVTLPTGGTISYTYLNFGTGFGCQNSGRAVATRTENANDGTGPHTWTYVYSENSSGLPTTTVTNPLGEYTVHTFAPLGSGDLCPTHETSVQYFANGGTLLKTVNTTYSFTPGGPAWNSTAPVNVVPIQVTTVWANALTSTVTKAYDSGYSFIDMYGKSTNTYANGAPDVGLYGKELAETVSDFGVNAAGPPLKTTNTSYLAFSNANYLAANMLGLPSSEQITDGSGNQFAYTSYGYDETSLQSSGVTTQFGAAPNGVRGNPTSTSHWLNITGGNVTSTAQWYDSGEVYSQTDPLGDTTTHSYSSSFAGAYPTQTCNALKQCVTGNYDFNTGLMTSYTDANNNTTTFNFDAMRRVTSIVSPPDPAGNHPQTTFTYSPAGTLPVAVERQKTVTPSLTDQFTVTFDGLARQSQSQEATPGGNATVVTQYDADGRKASVTNPYFSTSDPTYGLTQSVYDGLSRVTQVIKQDGSKVTTQYDQTSANSADGDCSTTTDEAGNARKSCVDGLGRLIEVDEPQASTGSLSTPYVTLYGYDILGNLLSVNQKGDGSQAARVRSFGYDSLSRLLTATNPESGQISYAYDTNGNVLQKTSPAPNQPVGSSATQTISYCYDALGRVTGKAYSAQTCQPGLNGPESQLPAGTAVVSYFYDAGTNGVGHLTSLGDQAGSGSYTFDALGRIGTEQRTIAGVSKSLSYTYNLDSSVATLKYPSGSTVTYTPDSAGRALSAVDVANNINYVTGAGGPNPNQGATYGADGSLLTYNNGWTPTFVGIANNFTYNPRLQPVNISAIAPGVGGGGATASVTISGSLGTAASSSGTPPAAAASGSALSGYEDSSFVNHWVYEGSNQHLYEFSWNSSSGGWSYADATVETGGPLAAPSSALSTYLDTNQNPHWIYEDGSQNIQLAAYTTRTNTWLNLDLTALSSAPGAASGSPLTSSEDSTCMQHWAYFGSNNHLYEIHVQGNAGGGCSGSGIWGFSDGTAATGAPAAASGSAMSMYFDNSQIAHWIYEDSSGHIQLLWWTSSGGWGREDVTATVGSPAAVAGSALGSYEDTNCMQHWLYLGTNQHLYEAHQQGNAGGGCSGSGVDGYTDVTAAAPSTVLDSGTVSLNVGGFTATACFGQSTNSACTGEPVNNTPAQVAAALAQALNVSSSPVTATVSGSTINMTAKPNFVIDAGIDGLSTTHDNPSLFSNASFTSAVAGFGGGTSVNLPVFNITYNFNLGNSDNGNVVGIANNRDNTRSETFTYDALNRLTSAKNAGTNCNQKTPANQWEYWGNTYTYDAWGNLLGKTVSLCHAENLGVTALANNQLSGYGYDAAGNMTHDAGTGNSYTYDQENRITGAAGYSYTYDADGNRVEKSSGGTGTIYWYMTPGIVAESDLSGNLKSEYVFFDGERVARRDFSASGTSVSYYFSDHLKTASVITDSAGNITEDEDYYPWGGEIQFINSDSNHYKFTGKERDTQTGLDYFGARYYGNWLGRWMSPDWSKKTEPVPYAKITDPQTLNLYGYTRDVPTTLIDDDGHGLGTPDWTSPEAQARKAQEASLPESQQLKLAATGFGVVFGPLAAVTVGGEALPVLAVRLAPLATTAGAALLKARDSVTNAVEELKNANLSSSPVTNSRISSAVNALKDHATNMDLTGIIREAAGVLKGNHGQEVGEVVDSLKNLRSSLQGALQNPNLGDEARTAYTNTIQQINSFVQKAQPIIDAAKKAVQGQ